MNGILCMVFSFKRSYLVLISLQLRSWLFQPMTNWIKLLYFLDLSTIKSLVWVWSFDLSLQIYRICDLMKTYTGLLLCRHSLKMTNFYCRYCILMILYKLTKYECCETKAKEKNSLDLVWRHLVMMILTRAQRHKGTCARKQKTRE